MRLGLIARLSVIGRTDGPDKTIVTILFSTCQIRKSRGRWERADPHPTLRQTQGHPFPQAGEGTGGEGWYSVHEAGTGPAAHAFPRRVSGPPLPQQLGAV